MIRFKFIGALFVLFVSFSNVAVSSSNDGLIFDAIKVGNLDRVKRVYKADRKSLNYVDSLGNYPIFYAIDKQGEFLDFMIENISDVSLSSVNKNGLNPLNYAISENKYNAVVKLLNRGVNPTMKDAHSKTAFHYAASGDENIVMIFKEYAKNNPEFASKFKANLDANIDDVVATVVESEDSNVVVGKAPEESVVGVVDEPDLKQIENLKNAVSLSMYSKFREQYRKEFFDVVKTEVEADLRSALVNEFNEAKEKELDMIKRELDVVKKGELDLIRNENIAAQLDLTKIHDESLKIKDDIIKSKDIVIISKDDVIKSKEKEIELMYNVFSELASVDKETLKTLIKTQVNK